MTTEVRSGTAGRAKPSDWLEQASDPAHSLKEQDRSVAVDAAALPGNHAPVSSARQPASAISLTSLAPPTLLLRETLGRNIQRTSSPSAAPPPLSSSDEEEGSSSWGSLGEEEEEEEEEKEGEEEGEEDDEGEEEEEEEWKR
ncbi:uncharacterized protein LOC144538348 [Centroberyx gerrardi]